MDYSKLTDKDYLELIFLMEDRLGLDYIEEAKKRHENIVPLLSDILRDNKNYRQTGSRSWGVVHAVHILGILGDQRAMDALLAASENAEKYDIDWIWDALPECYLRIGPPAIPKLKAYIKKNKSMEKASVLSEVSGLWNIWSIYQRSQKEIEDFFLDIIKSSSRYYELRTHLIMDFAEIKRHDLRPLFEECFESGEIDLNVATLKDLEFFFEGEEFLSRISQRPGGVLQR